MQDVLSIHTSMWVKELGHIICQKSRLKINEAKHIHCRILWEGGAWDQKGENHQPFPHVADAAKAGGGGIGLRTQQYE